MEFIPLEDDLLSMEMDDVARDIYLVRTSTQIEALADIFQDGDDTPLFYSSLALMTFQRAFGLFPRILGKGDAAKVSQAPALIHHSLTSRSGCRACCSGIAHLGIAITTTCPLPIRSTHLLLLIARSTG